MVYTKTTWQDRVVQNPLTYDVQNNADGSITLIPKPGTITQAGTPINAANMNNLEEGFTTHLADFVAQPANGGTTGGTATAYTCSSNPAPTAFADKMGIVITAHADSGANPTLAWNTLAAKPIKKPNGNAAVLKAGGIYTLRYNVTSGNFILQGEGASGNATASDLLSGKTASTDAGDIIGTMPNKVGSGTIITPSNIDQAIPQGYYGGAIGDGKVKAVTLEAGDVLLLALDTQKNTSVTSFTKQKDVQIDTAGVARIKFDMRSYQGGKAYGQIYVNGQPVGVLRTHDYATNTYFETYTEDISINAGDSVQLYVKQSSGSYLVNVKNFRVYASFKHAQFTTIMA